MAYNPVNPADALDQGVNQINDAFDQVAKWFRGTTAPSSPEAGMKWYNTTDSTLYVRNDSNTTWLPCLLLDSETGLIVTDGTDTITICAPATLAGDYVLKLPATQGGSNQFLQNDGSGNLTWVSGGATGATQLNDLSDVTITGTPAAGAYIRHDGSTFVNSTQLDIDKLNITAQTRGDLIYYDGTNWNRLAVSSNNGDVLTSSGTAPQWTTPVTGKNTLADLNDVTLTSEAAGDYLRYSGSAWVNNTGVTAGDIIAGSDAQGDILVRGASAYQRLAAGTATYVLTSNGAGTTPSWQAAASTSVALNDLTDVTITTATLGQTLRYDGSGWVNADPLLTDLTVGGEQPGDLAYYNGTSWNRLAKGSSDQFLRATASSINWETVQLGATSLDGLSDVAISAPASGRYLRHDGSNFVDHPGVLLGDLSHPSAADGDLIYRSGGTFTRLAAGTNGQVLTVNSSGIPSWQGAASGVTTLGGLSDVTLSTPTEDQFLRYSSGKWVNETVALVDSIGDLSDVTVTAADGDLLWYDSSTSQWVALTIGSAGDVLTVQAGEPSWQTPSSGATTLGGLSDVSISGQAAGDLLYASSASAWGNLAKGSDNQVLTVVSGALSWQTPTTGVTTLAALTDVTITSAGSGDYLRYDGSAWVNHPGVQAADLSVPSQAQGDLMYRGASSWGRLALGTNGQVLQSNGTDAAWATLSTALDDLTDVAITGIEAEGDVLYHTGSNWDRLAKGSSGQVLTATGTSINWATPTTGSTTLGGLSDVTITSQAAGDLLYASSASAWGNVAVGSTGDVLTVSGGGLPVWAAPSSGATTLGGLSDVTITAAADGDYLRHNGSGWVNAPGLAIGDLTHTSEARGDLVYYDGAEWNRLERGGDNTFLRSTSASIAWETPPISDLSDVDLSGAAAGAVVYFDGSNWIDLALGTSGQVLQAGASAPAWATLSTALNDLTDVTITSQAAGDLLYASSASAWGNVAVGSTGDVLTVSGGGLPVWAAPSSGATTLGGLSDVTITAAADGDYLRHNGSNWVNAPGLAIGDLTVASEATGDLIYRSAGGWTRLGIGTNGQQLISNGTLPAWSDHGLNNLTDVQITTPANNDLLIYNSTANQWQNQSTLDISSLHHGAEAQGDLIYYDGGDWNRLARGADNTFLRSTATSVAWETPPISDLSDVDLSGAAAGAVIYFDGSNWIDLALGTSGQVLQAGASAPAWATLSTALNDLTDVTITAAGTGDYLRYNGTAWVNHPGVLVGDLTVASEAQGDLIYRGASGWTRLGVGTSGQLLQSSGTEPAWATVTTALGDLTDVTITGTEAGGDVLYYTGSNWDRLARGGEGQVLTATLTSINWETPTTGSTTLAALDDTFINSPATGDYLRYLAAIGDWVNVSGLLVTDLTVSGEAEGDLIYHNGTSYTRLPLGSDGQVLTATATTVNWETPTSGSTTLDGLTDVTITSATAGDYLRYSGAGWVNDATVDASDLTAAAGNSTGDILYRTISGYDRLTVGTNGHVLTVSSGVPAWQAPSSGDLGDLTDVTITTQATGDLLYASSGTAWGNLEIGTSGQVLSVSAGGVPEWVTSSGGGGASDLDGLSDVTITSVAGGDLLLHDGSQWINKAFGNFQMTTKVAKQVLYWSGANWKNEYLLPSDLWTFGLAAKSFIGRLNGGWTAVASAASASAGDHLTWNGTDFEWMALDMSSQNLDSFADVSYTVTPAGGDLLVYGTSSWGILDASAASLGDVLTRNSSSSLGWVSSTGTGSIVKSISPTLTGTIRCDNIDATTNVSAAQVILDAPGARTIAHRAGATNNSYTVTWPSISQLPSSGTYYLTIDSSGNIGYSAT